MDTTAIEFIDDRNIAARMRMYQLENPAEWTEMSVQAIDFDIDITDSLFTLSNLRNPRQ
jgi:hypothetical protein